MKKFSSLKCPVCGKVYKEVAPFGNHVRNEHPGTIPEGWSDLRYTYFVLTGKDHGKCRECGGDTAWNETTGSYARICGSEACKKAYRDRFMASMRSRYGKTNMLEDPNYRERMLTGRKISGEYQFADGGKVAYMGNLEKAFLTMMDQFFRFPSSDILSPSPNRYNYYYENAHDPANSGMHMYVPDFWIPSCNLEIELKSAINQRPKNLMIDVPKDAQKDIFMIRDPMVNFVKIYEDDYHVLFQVFADLAQQKLTGKSKPIKYISRSLLTSIYRDYIPDDCLKILDEYTYKYSDKSVMKKVVKATEADSEEDEEIFIEGSEPEEDPEIEETDFSIDDVYDDPEDEESEENSEDEDDSMPESVGVNPLMYYMMGEYAPPDAMAEESFNMFAIDDEARFSHALEGLFGIPDGLDMDKIDGRAAAKYSRWRDRLFGGKLFGNTTAKMFTKVTIENGLITIKGINCNLLLYRIKEKYSEAKLKYIFEYHYNAKSWKLYQKKKIGRGDMKIDYVYAPEFFCLELVELFNDLGQYYNDASYRRIAQMIYEASWLSKADTTEVAPISLAPLDNMALELLPHQKTFIQQWPSLKNQLHTNGYILAFKPGKGKTLTAIGLSECLKTPKVYIVCPNNLKDNWALEIKKYFTKYQEDEKLWMHDVCILGTRYGDPKTARYIITNNENIKLMMPVAEKNPDAMLILDECHNFRNFNGGRSKELFALADKIGSENVLCVSATPIKASPAEITPALRLIDPTFNDDAAAMYAHCFDLSDTMAMSLVNKRFGKIIYRPADAEVDLPPKNLSPLNLSVKDDERYYLSIVHAEIIAEFQRRHTEWLQSNGPASKDFRDSIHRYTMGTRHDADAYLNWVFTSSNSLLGGNDEREFHELSIREYKEFIEKYIAPNPNCPAGEVDRLTNIQNEFITAAKRDMGKAVGSILPKRRSDMFIAMYDENKEKIYDMIRHRGKKTVIFSTMVPVVKHIAKDLNDFGIGTVTISGDTKDRLSILTKFREDPNTLVMVATSWCLGVGVTLTEASQMFFFGPPWRSTDFEQASDRIWRIGQTDTVDIWTAKLKSHTKSPNLSDRMQDILDWSSKMFGSAITSAEIDDTPPEALAPATEAYKKRKYVTSYDDIRRMQKFLFEEFKPVGSIEDYYHTQNPGVFNKAHRGTCFDFMAFEDLYSRSYGLHPYCYLLFNAVSKRYHCFVLLADGNKFIYPEAFDKRIAGVYHVINVNEVASFIINMTDGPTPNPTQWKLIRMKSRYGRYNETTEELASRIINDGVVVQFKYNHNVRFLEPLTDDETMTSATESFNMNIDGAQYELVNDEEIDVLTKVHDIFYSYLTRRAGVESQIKHPEKGGIAYTKGDWDRTEWENVKDLYDTLCNRLSGHPMNTPIIQMVNLTIDGGAEIHHPIVVIPFKDGALYLETTINDHRNNIYYVMDVFTAPNAAANWITMDYELVDGTLSGNKDKIHVSCTTVAVGTDNESANGKTYSIDYNAFCTDLHEVEVMNHGWAINRY